MKEQIIEKLKKIVEATRIISPAEFSFSGKVFSCPAVSPAVEPNPAQPPLVLLLQNCFYQYCYVQPFDGNISLETRAVMPNPNLVQRLSEANETREYWETGWQIREILASGQIRAKKNERTRFLWAGEFFSPGSFGTPPKINSEISVFFPKESVTVQTGFYFAFSQTFLDQSDDYNIVRFYWNIDEKGAPDLVRSISHHLNKFQVPYRFKCLNNQHPFNRTDAAVLFINKRFYRIVAELLPDIYRKVEALLEDETPLFSKRLAPGLGLAEDSNSGDSFGMNRCRILAQGIWNGYVKGLQTTETRLQETSKQFAAHGISLETPYLNAGAADQYIVPDFSAAPLSASATK